MKIRIVTILCLSAGVLFLNACGGKKDEQLVKEGWKIVLKQGKEDVEFRLSVMNIYVTDPVVAAQYPEAFEIFGENIHLIGTFPLDVRVGYDSALQNLLQKPIKIKMQMMNAKDYKIDKKFSSVRLPDGKRKYVKGEITFRKMTGTTKGRDGDLTLTGDITLEIGTGSDRQVLTGQISIHPVAWG